MIPLAKPYSGILEAAKRRTRTRPQMRPPTPPSPVVKPSGMRRQQSY